MSRDFFILYIAGGGCAVIFISIVYSGAMGNLRYFLYILTEVV